MASIRQIQANRRNAKKSTGPRTPEGKAISSRNSIRHGLLAREIVLSDEDPEEFLALVAALAAEHRPVGRLEDNLIEQMAGAEWRLRRLARVENGLFEERLRQVRKQVARDPEDETLPASCDEHAALTRLLGLSFHRDAVGADSLAKLARYEAMIKRYFYKALHELQAAQNLRKPQRFGKEKNSRSNPNSRPKRRAA